MVTVIVQTSGPDSTGKTPGVTVDPRNSGEVEVTVGAAPSTLSSIQTALSGQVVGPAKAGAVAVAKSPNVEIEKIAPSLRNIPAYPTPMCLDVLLKQKPYRHSYPLIS